MDQHLIPPICIQVIIQSTTVWLFQMQSMYVHLFLATYGTQIGNQVLKEFLRFFCLFVLWASLAYSCHLYQYGNTKRLWKALLWVRKTFPRQQKYSLIMSFSFMENLSLLLASSGGSYLILYSTCSWGVCECRAAQMNEWTNTPTAGECNLLQSWARFPVQKVGGRMLC